MPLLQDMIEKLNYLFVTLFGIGKISKIPGSIASLVTTIFLFFLFHILNVKPDIVLIAIIVLVRISISQFLETKCKKSIILNRFT